MSRIARSPLAGLSTLIFLGLVSQQSVAGASGGAGFVSAETVVAGDEQGGRAKVLIICDSVFDGFEHVASAREQLVR